MYNSLIIRNSYLAEVQLTQAPANGNKTYFLDIATLRDVETVGIECFSTLGLTFSPNGNAIVPSLRGLVLVLAVDSLEKFFQIPCYTLESGNNAGIIREIARQKINLPKSYVMMVDSSLYTVNQSLCVNFYYSNPRAGAGYNRDNK